MKTTLRILRTVCIGLLIFLSTGITLSSPATAAETLARPGSTIKIITVGNRANLRVVPNGRNSINRIKTGTKLNVLDTNSIRLPLGEVTWYKVIYMGDTGWVSQYDTDIVK